MSTQHKIKNNNKNKMSWKAAEEEAVKQSPESSEEKRRPCCIEGAGLQARNGAVQRH
jgi:hypothetical protein